MQIFIEFLTLRKSALNALLDTFPSKITTKSEQGSNISITQLIGNSLCEFCRSVISYIIQHLKQSNLFFFSLENTLDLATQLNVFSFRMLQMTLYLISCIFLSNSKVHLISHSQVETQKTTMTTTTTASEPTAPTFSTQRNIQISPSSNKIKEVGNESTVSFSRKSLLYHLLDQISLTIEGTIIWRC
jgi:hypothetical protein